MLSFSIERALDAPIVRQLFDSSPNDPRYHMLTWISHKFSRRLNEPLHEPRAALFVNRFTRTATIMYATSGVSEILGLSPHQLVSRSFFYCIQEACLRDAVRCLEGAKSNDSIAYLRFWFRNPLQDDNVDMDGNPTYGANPSVDATTNTSSPAIEPIELEAVVSCTSDGLVVILRRARPPIPAAAVPPQPVPVYANGLFAAPWALEPVFSYGAASYPHDSAIRHSAYPEEKRTFCRDDSVSMASASASVPVSASASASASASSGQGSWSQSSGYDFAYPPFPEEPNTSGPGGPNASKLMDTIRDVAVFAWGIVGINRSLEQYKCGTPAGDAHPADGDTTMEDARGNQTAAGRS